MAFRLVGGYPGDDEKGGALFNQVDKGKMTEDFAAAAQWLKARPESTGKLSGSPRLLLRWHHSQHVGGATRPDLAAAVPFYGVQPSAADTAKIKAPINAQYAELDTRITSGWPAFDAELTASGVPHEGHIYKGANHGFHNDTTRRATTRPPRRRRGATRSTGFPHQQIFAGLKTVESYFFLMRRAGATDFGRPACNWNAVMRGAISARKREPLNTP